MVVNSAPRILVGDLRDRPPAEGVPFGTVFVAQDPYGDECDLYVLGDKGWMISGRPNSTPIKNPLLPTESTMTITAKPKKFIFECDNHAFDPSYRHDKLEFIWDGQRNLADARSIELAALYDSVASGRIVCKCGARLKGGEVQRVEFKEGEDVTKQVLDELYSLRESNVLLAQQVQSLIQSNQKGVTPMSMEESKMKKAANALKSNAGDALWRVGATQATRTVKSAVIAGVLKGIPKSKKALRQQMVAFLETPYGDAFAGLMLSVLIQMTGAPEGSKRARLADELRIGAMTSTMNDALNVFLDPIRSFLATDLDGILINLPEPSENVNPIKEEMRERAAV